MNQQEKLITTVPTSPATLSGEVVSRWKTEIRGFLQVVRQELHDVVQSLPADEASNATGVRTEPLDNAKVDVEVEDGRPLDRLAALKRQLDEHLKNRP
jgi:hypothetical protein